MTVVNEEFFEEMNKRNLDRAKKSAALLGEKWLLHPTNQVKRKKVSCSVLDAPKFLLKDARV